jgi:hypothetical protein
MNNQPDDSTNTTQTVLRTLHAQQRTRRALIAMALGLGILSIIASVAIAWANLAIIAPMQRLLLEDYPSSALQSGQNAEGKSPLTKEQLDWRHVQVTAAHGKAMFLTDASIVLLAGGTLVILVLVIVNRRATLRQINASLAQISDQLNALQRRQEPGA